jgi:transcriptional regulator with XRE-family HTH domain
MAQRAQIVNELKLVLRERGLTYAEVARKLRLSVASIKRLFSTGDFSLQRIDEICELCGLEVSELLEQAQQRGLPTNRLTVAQEQEVVADPKLFLVTWLIINRARFDQIVRDYQLTERELQRYLIRLDRLKIIELQPFNKVRLLVSRQFSWRPGGPVQSYIHQKLLKEFLATTLTSETDEFFFHGGAISDHVLGQLKKVLQNAARECSEMMEDDSAPTASRRGAAFVLALRRWEYSGFAQFMRK